MPINEKNILIAPINLEEAYNYMGATSANGIYDVYTLASSDLINKWAKCKPIRYPKKEELTELERAGSVQDRMNGIYYGIKLSGVSGKIEDMHNVTFDYYPIREGEDWARLSDFDGYDKNAKPNPVGTLPEVIYIDLNKAHGECYVNYDTSNTTGVDISDAIKAMTITGSDFDGYEWDGLGDFYPCVLVTIGTKKYVRALWNLNFDLELRDDDTQKYNGFTKMRDNGAWYGQWAILMDGLYATEGTEMTTTIFFIREITADIGYDWREWSELNNQIFANNGFACPEAVAKKIMLKRYHSKGMEVISGTWSRKVGSTSAIIVNLLTEWVEPRADVTYKLKGSLFVGNNNVAIGSFERDYVYDGQLQDAMFDVNTNTLNLPTTTNIKLVWEVISSANPTTPCNSGETTLEYNDQSIN